MSPDWSAKEEPVPYATFGNPQSLNLYEYVGNNPLSKADPDGHDFNKVLQDLKAAFSQLPAKVTAGVGIGGKVKVGPITGELEAAYKGSIKFSAADGKLSLSKGVDLSATVGKGETKVGLGASAEQTIVSVNVATGEVGGPEPVEGDKTRGISQGSSSGSGSGEGFALGGEEGEGILGRGEISITKKGIENLKSAWTDLKETLSIPAPPPAPKPPAPPQNQ